MSKTASTVVRISNRLGMHARPAMMFVETASEFEADVKVRRVKEDGERFNGKSIMEMMMLAATQGTEIEITAEGRDAEKVLEALTELVDSGFQEE